MGVLLSCCHKPSKREQLVNERTRLLVSRDVSYNDLASGVWHSNGQYSDESVEAPNETKTDAQNNKIVSNSNKCVDRLAAKMIDISTIDQPIDRMEYKRRVQMYNSRTAAIRNPMVLRSKLMARPAIQNVTTTDPISKEDLQLIHDLAERASLAVHENFRIRCDEPVVVIFDPK